MNAGNARSSMQRVPQRAVRGRAASTVDPAQTAVRAQARPGRGASATATPVNAAEVARTDLPPSRGRTRTWSPCTHRRAGSRAQWCRHHRRPGDRQLPNGARWRPLRRATSHLPLAQQLLPHASQQQVTQDACVRCRVDGTRAPADPHPAWAQRIGDRRSLHAMHWITDSVILEP